MVQRDDLRRKLFSLLDLWDNNSSVKVISYDASFFHFINFVQFLLLLLRLLISFLLELLLLEFLLDFSIF